jgi:hypothetical protein
VSSDDQFDQVVEMVSTQESSLPVGTGRALLVGADGVVRDDSWIEVLLSEAGVVALVQADGPNYRRAIVDALSYPTDEDDRGDELLVPSGELAIFSSASDGAGQYATRLLPARPGPLPLEHGRPARGVEPGVLLQTSSGAYRLRIRWYTLLDDDSCFARWLLLPTEP